MATTEVGLPLKNRARDGYNPRMRAAAKTLGWLTGGLLLPHAAVASAAEEDHVVPADAGTARTQEELSTPSPGGFALDPEKIEAPDRVTGIAELGLGWLTLPRALVCGEGNACRRGDTTPLVEIWNLLRLDFGLAFGAGVGLGLVPTTDAPRENPPGIERNHRRGYMTIESMVRYYPWLTGDVEGWVGVGGGLVIVSDRFVPDREQRYAFVGTPGVTLRTEGLSLFGALGASVVLSEYWTLGFVGRAGIWRLPDEPARSPFNDEASLSGTNTIVYAGISVAFQQIL